MPVDRRSRGAQPSPEVPHVEGFQALGVERYDIPGLVAAVWHEGTETFAAHGVTNLDNPQQVDENTLYAVGSTSKPFAATALMHVVARGEVDLDAPVRHYLPELRLPNEEWTAQITVKQLLNHTAGLDWRLITDTGDADDALAEFIARLAGLEQIGAPGGRASYTRSGSASWRGSSRR
jgi:CubicO group peptidase (beta-lactamase class C family)